MNKKRKIVVGLIVSVVLILILLVSIALARHASLKAEVENFISKAEMGDLHAFDINSKETKEQNIDRALLEAFKEADMELPFITNIKESELTEGEKIYQSILQHSEMDYAISKFTNKVKFEVLAPDMERFIKNMDTSAVRSEEELFEKMYSYIASGEKAEFTTEIKYKRIKGTWVADYTQKDFLNAFTGGIPSGYNYLYNKMLKEYKNGLGE